MMKQLILTIVCFVVLISSCGQNPQQQEQLTQALQEADSLKLALAKGDAEMEEMLTLLNEIDDNFQRIKTAESYLTVQSAATGEMSASTKDRINSDMKLLAETLTKNKEQIDKLHVQLRRSGVQSAELQKVVARKQQELEEKTTLITTLQAELAKRDMRIAELDEVVSTLNVRNSLQDALIEKQANTLNTAFFCFGTAKELKAQNIVTGGGFSSQKVLEPGFNKSYFSEIDIRKVEAIELYAPKAVLKTSHPNGTYEFVVNSRTKELTFKILDAEKFWSVTRYLVIEVKF